MFLLLLTWPVVLFSLASSGTAGFQPERQLLRPRQLNFFGSPRGTGAAEKRQRERTFSSNALYGRYAPREPTCEQLRAMWKLSHRQHRNMRLRNSISRYQEPFMLGRVRNTLQHNPLYDSPRPRPIPAYGTVRHTPGPSAETSRPQPAAIKELVRLMPPAASSSLHGGGGRGRPDKIRQLVRMFGSGSLDKPQGIAGNYGRVHHYPRPRKDGYSQQKSLVRPWRQANQSGIEKREIIVKEEDGVRNGGQEPISGV